MRGFSIKVLTALLLAGLMAGMLIWWNSLPAEKVSVYIPEGASARKIGGLLKQNGLISSEKVFYALLKVMRKDKSLKSGLYEISKRDGIFRIISDISRGKAAYLGVTIPEGFTARQTAERFAQRGITDKDKFLSIVNDRKLEGYLFPQTYQFEINMPAEKVVEKMLSEFEVNVSSRMRADIKKLKNMDLKKIVVLASIIEKEAKLPAERPLIASVFYNRLKKGMYLESCATVQYALGEHKERLTYKDTKIESPYNTYKCYGLPPAPICNPGLDSIKAAIYPEKTDDLFFVISSSGTHTFSRYFKEHVKSKIKNKKRRPAQGKN